MELDINRPLTKPLSHNDRILLFPYLYGAGMERISEVAKANGITPEEAEGILERLQQDFKEVSEWRRKMSIG